MALDNYGIYCQAAIARSLAAQIGGGDVAMQVTIDNAINTAIGAGLFTATASVAAGSSQNIQNNMNMLKAMGYTVSLAGTTLTVSWF